MDGLVDITDTRQGKQLARAAARLERLAEIAAERAEAAQTAEEFRIYSDAVARHSRGLRMTLALESKIVRDTFAYRREAAVAEREHRAERELQTAEARARRKRELCERISAEMWREWEGEPDLVDEAISDLRERLERESKLDTFLEEPIDYQVERFKTIFGLDGREVPDLPADWNEPDDDEDDDDESEPEDSS